MNQKLCLLALLPVAALVSCRRSAEPATPKRKVLYYRNPMNPSITSPAPKKDEMGMDYVPVYADELASDGGVPGYGAVTLPAEAARAIGLRTVTVEPRRIGGLIRTSARVAADERRIANVTARFDGYVERLYASYTGQTVRRGDPLLSVYSPQLYATEQEYLLARASGQTLARAGLPGAAQAARDRLRLLGIPDGEIDRLAKRGAPERALTLPAPISGVITQKSVVVGSRVAPDAPLYQIIDLSRVWALADVYENELPRLRTGERATLTLPYWPGRSWTGRVSFIEPVVDPKTRTVEVRVDIANPRGELKPEMFGDVAIETGPEVALVIPEDAVIVTGTRKVVFIVSAGERLEPREIEVGVHSEGLYQVRRGLKAGDRVAAGASFLLDSESRLRAVAPVPSAPDGGAR